MGACFLGPENGESSGNGGGGIYSFLWFIKNVEADGKNNSVIAVHKPTLQIIWDLCIPEKELAKTLNSFT
jgi:hypothetical protein